MYKDLIVDGKIRRETLWDVVSGGFMVRDQRDFNRSGESFLSDAELQDIHENLPVAIRIYAQRTSQITGSDVADMLQLWQSSMFVQTRQGKLIGLYDVTEVFLLSQTIGIAANHIPYYECCALETKRIIFMPLVKSPVMLEVTHTWLDANYPDWNVRLSIAESLDFSGEEKIKSIIDNPMRFNNSVDLPNNDMFDKHI